MSESSRLRAEPAPRQLILMRHAKAQDPQGRVDHDRVLNERGRADADAAGRWFREQGLVPDQVLCSTAARTRETWQRVVDAGGVGALVDHEPRIYNAPAGRLLDVLREVNADTSTVVMVGHAPGIPDLAAVLSEGQGETDAQVRLQGAFPTCAIAVLDIQTAWADLAPGSAVLRTVHVPRA